MKTDMKMEKNTGIGKNKIKCYKKKFDILPIK